MVRKFKYLIVVLAMIVAGLGIWFAALNIVAMMNVRSGTYEGLIRMFYMLVILGALVFSLPLIYCSVHFFIKENKVVAILIKVFSGIGLFVFCSNFYIVTSSSTGVLTTVLNILIVFLTLAFLILFSTYRSKQERLLNDSKTP